MAISFYHHPKKNQNASKIKCDKWKASELEMKQASPMIIHQCLTYHPLHNIHYIHGWTHVFINFHNLQLRSFPFISSYFLDFWFMLMSCEINVCITPLLRTERKFMLETMFVLDLKLNWTCFCMSLKPSFSSFLSVFDAWLNTVVCSPSISA